jgi:NAD+ kinase
MKISLLASRAPLAQEAFATLLGTFDIHNDPQTADVIVALGGDGFMLEVLHGQAGGDVPVYGMNRGTVGFLMNTFSLEDLPDRIKAAIAQSIHPLRVTATLADGTQHQAKDFNEISMLRQGPQAANLRISVNGKEQMDNLVCDGALIATPAGSTAYNASANGPILPIDANVLALTPLAPFRPRRWRGAVLPNTATVVIENTNPEKRPVMINAGGIGLNDVVRAEINLARNEGRTLLFDPGHALEDRILGEQFI